MRPYLAIIKDSFREAMASRVLWVLLVLSTLLLAALVPIGFEEELASNLREHELLDVLTLCKQLESEGESTDSSPSRHIWSLLSEELKESVSKVAAADSSDSQPLWMVDIELRIELNKLLTRRDFYEASAWKDVEPVSEAKELLALGVENLPDDQVGRLNRLLLEAAYPELIASSQEKVVFVAYFGYTILEDLPIEADQIRSVLTQALAGFTGFFVGIVGIFVAILVTSPMIPRTFDAGAIDLLLSKPVSRWLLFLSKFAGGSAFIFLNASYFIVGIWLIAGLRHDIWSEKLLLCIPVFLFLFVIYYSISAFVGVVWKGAVMSVMMTILFWVACTVVGTAKGMVEAFYVNRMRLTVLVPAGETLIAANRGGEVFEWESDEHRWKPVFKSTGPSAPNFAFISPIIGPVYDAVSDSIVAVESTAMPRGFAMFSSSGKVLIGRREEGWRRIKGTAAPFGVNAVFVDADGKILVAGPPGLYRFAGDPTVEHKPFKVFGIDIAPKNQGGKFEDVTPEGLERFGTPFAVARNPADGSLAVFDQGRLLLLREQHQASFTLSKEIDLNTDEPAALAYSGGTVVIALGDGKIRVLNADAATPGKTFEPFGSRKPRSVVASNDGRWFAVQYHHRHLWLYDAVKQQPIKVDIIGQGNVSAASFTSQNTLLVADRVRRVIEYRLDPFDVVHRYEPESEVLERVYRYGLVPLYTIFPKPGELDNMVSYLLTDRKDIAATGDEDNLESERIVLDIWKPIISNVAFLAVMLTLTCVYISYKDF
jgi:ABC-type transport system involved in multi-copper enzyme maturation permease subunit